jgi:hypothetical protein
MANIEHFDVKPRAATIAQRDHEINRTHNMLVATVIGSMIIIVVGALFLTMF